MQKIPINLAKPGMKLARPVVKDGGITVMAEGMELTEALISRLDTMKIDKIVVQGNPVDIGESGGGTAFDERLARMPHLFRHYKQDKWMSRVRDRMIEYFRFKAAQQAARERAEQERDELMEEPENGETVENGGEA
ncbi:hypothetical protein [Salidesulfovibrio brasiliensis]|uniref:hypothetical protein n=1 Tax=Salidesulfovibrio brasiliensis TaxID=221711 RepID=UPI0006CFC903|nr:hypothetical protein [Salidesulfovibrio brasiliensis]